QPEPGYSIVISFKESVLQGEQHQSQQIDHAKADGKDQELQRRPRARGGSLQEVGPRERETCSGDRQSSQEPRLPAQDAAAPQFQNEELEAAPHNEGPQPTDQGIEQGARRHGPASRSHAILLAGQSTSRLPRGSRAMRESVIHRTNTRLLSALECQSPTVD